MDSANLGGDNIWRTAGLITTKLLHLSPSSFGLTILHPLKLNFHSTYMQFALHSHFVSIVKPNLFFHVEIPLQTWNTKWNFLSISLPFCNMWLCSSLTYTLIPPLLLLPTTRARHEWGRQACNELRPRKFLTCSTKEADITRNGRKLLFFTCSEHSSCEIRKLNTTSIVPPTTGTTSSVPPLQKVERCDTRGTSFPRSTV